ncbi:villin-1 isoform X2 [Nymphaea colorata]|uniref:villin-1 isoform X2 n=1 Tax=Nymphaea colorata TaxID=210225 RepID=UPI00214F0F64|nr:villin-1 isoform X2 [Nymphaea colorata]
MLLNDDGVDVAFQGAGAKAGLEIWCIENLRVVAVPKSSHGKFFCGSSYIILNTIFLRSGVPYHDIHYWLGKDMKPDDSTMASDKALELDVALGYHAVQYREVQGHESEKFLSYFKPCIIPLEGVFSSETGRSDNGSYQVSLFVCKGERAARVKEVPFSRSSLNHDDVFILDTESKMYLFSGCNSRIQQRAKALEVVQYINENNHIGKCDVAAIEDGKFVGDPDVGEFWSLFGGYAPISKNSASLSNVELQGSSAKLYWVARKKLCLIGDNLLKKDLLCSDKCYMLDCDGEIFLWMGKNTSLTERKESILTVEDTIHSQGRSRSTNVTFLTEGSETVKFTTYFDCWPQVFAQSLYEEGKGKVAAMFKQHGFDVRELPTEDPEPYIDCVGSLKVWRVASHTIVPVETGKLFSGNCYILQYTYLGDEKEECIFYAWFGSDSTMEDRVDAISLMHSQVDSVGGQPVMAQLFEGKETVQFFYIFQRLVIYKGGLSSECKKYVEQNGIADEMYHEGSIALFRVQGTGSANMQAIQVNLVSSSLNSSFCYILEAEAFMFVWTGNLSSPKDHDIADRMLDHLNPKKQPIQVKEGSEPDIFWDAIGGKMDYPKEKDTKEFVEDPHLFVCIGIEGDLKVKEIFNFSQDDLTTEDVFILNCHTELYVWIGQHAKFRSKESAFSIAKKFIDLDILLEGMSLETAIHVVMEGYEPKFFTRFFSWDTSKASMHGNSFERKLAVVKGLGPKLETDTKKDS